MRITGINRRGSRRVEVLLEGGFRLPLAAEVALRSGLRVGALLDPERRAALEAEDLAWRVKEAALRLLSRRARAQEELRRRLVGNGYPEAVVERCVGELREAGLVDDAAFARSRVLERIRNRPSGTRRLLWELQGSGVEEELAARVVREALAEDGLSEVDLARRAAERFARRTGGRAGPLRERMGRYLARRGFAMDAILQVLEDREWVGNDDPGR